MCIRDRYQSIAQTILNPTWIKAETSSNLNEIAEGWGIDVDNVGNIYWATSIIKFNQGLDIKCYKYDVILENILFQKRF